MSPLHHHKQDQGEPVFSSVLFFSLFKKFCVVWLPLNCLQQTPPSLFTQPVISSVSKNFNSDFIILILLFNTVQRGKRLFLFCSRFSCCSCLCSRFGSFGSVLGTSLGTSVHTGSIQGTTHNVITHTRKVLHTSAAHQHDRVFLQVVSFSRNVSIHFLRVR